MSTCVPGINIYMKNVRIWDGQLTAKQENSWNSTVKSSDVLKPEQSQNQGPGIFCFSLLLPTLRQFLTLCQKPSKASRNHSLSHSLSLHMSLPVAHSYFSPNSPPLRTLGLQRAEAGWPRLVRSTEATENDRGVHLGVSLTYGLWIPGT